MDAVEKTRKIKTRGFELGFSHVGIIPCHDFNDYAEEVRSRPRYAHFVKRPISFVTGCYPSKYFPEGKSIVVATYGFGDIDYPESLRKHIGRIYMAHCYSPLPESINGMREAAMASYLKSLGMSIYEGKHILPARPAAEEAGIVKYGANNFVRTEEDGSFVVLCTWIVDAELCYDEREPYPECPESCHRCIEACPTGAIESPRHLNPKKCILANNMGKELYPGIEDAIGEHIHGCDICQEVCPRNQHVLQGAHRKDAFLEELARRFDLEKILMLPSFDDPYYLEVVRPIMYNYIRDVDLFRRNAAIALGNSGDPSHVPALEQAAARFPGTQTETAARWAIGKLRAATE